MTDWRQLGWCDVCEITLTNGADGDGVVCPDCGFDSRVAEANRLREQHLREACDDPLCPFHRRMP